MHVSKYQRSNSRVLENPLAVFAVGSSPNPWLVLVELPRIGQNGLVRLVRIDVHFAKRPMLKLLAHFTRFVCGVVHKHAMHLKRVNTRISFAQKKKRSNLTTDGNQKEAEDTYAFQLEMHVERPAFLLCFRGCRRQRAALFD